MDIEPHKVTTPHREPGELQTTPSGQSQCRYYWFQNLYIISVLWKYTRTLTFINVGNIVNVNFYIHHDRKTRIFYHIALYFKIKVLCENTKNQDAPTKNPPAIVICNHYTTTLLNMNNFRRKSNQRSTKLGCYDTRFYIELRCAAKMQRKLLQVATHNSRCDTAGSTTPDSNNHKLFCHLFVVDRRL